MTPHPPRQAPLRALALAAAIAVAAFVAPAQTASASTNPLQWTPLGDSADRAMPGAGRRSMGQHSQAVRDHIGRTPNGRFNAAARAAIQTFPSLDPATYFSIERTTGLLDRGGLTDAARLRLGRGARVGLSPAEARQWAAAACHGSLPCAEALLDGLRATLREENRVTPHDLERHFFNGSTTEASDGTTRRAQQAALHALYRLTMDAALAAGHLDGDTRGRALAALDTRADLPGWPASRTVLTMERPRRGGSGVEEQFRDPVQLAQAVTETANGIMDDALPEIDILGGTTLSTRAGGTWLDGDWNEVGYGGDMATFSIVGSRPLNDTVTFGMASTWEFPGWNDGGFGTTGRALTVGPFVSVDLDSGVSFHALGTVSQFNSDVSSWYGYGDGSFSGNRTGAAGGISYGTTQGRWQFGGTAQATWFTQTRNRFTDSAGRDNPETSVESGQIALSGRLAYGGDLSDLSPRLEGSFRPWAAADALVTAQTPDRPGYALSGPEPVRGRLRLGLDVTPEGGPSVTIQGGASNLGTDNPSFNASAGLRLKF